MLSEERWFAFMSVLILLVRFGPSDAQSTPTGFRASDIQITPEFVILNSTDTVNFTCSNYRSNDAPLEANLSKVISSDEIRFFTSPLNKTALHIRLESINYVGAFHLLCYAKGERSKGNRADIIVTAAPGILQLAEKCHVYDRQYIKCVIRAPTIARAAHNDYPAKFEFNEIAYSPDHLAYRPRFEFLKGESTKETLAFKWQPTIDGEFPSGVRMHMKAILPHFDESSYYFDMTPVFRITPKFNLRALSSSQIQMNINPVSPAAFCEKSIVSKLASNSSQTWTVVEPNQNKTVLNNLISNSLYRVCMKCRQAYTDPDGAQECQDIRTFSRFHWFAQYQLWVLPVVLLVVVLIALGLIFLFLKRHPRSEQVKNLLACKFRRVSTDSEVDTSPRVPYRPRSPPRPSSRGSSITPGGDDDAYTHLMAQDRYVPLADLHDVLTQCDPPALLSASDT